MLLTQLNYDLRMFFRELFYLVFTIVIPPASYMFLGQLFTGNVYGDGLNYVQFYTPSFIILITFSVVFFAFGFDEVMNRSLGIEKRINATPVNGKIILLSNILKSIIITSFGFLLITVIGILMYDLSISAESLLLAFIAFICINAILLTISSAIYSFFNEMKSALVFSIVIFQVVIFTGDFTMPVESMPEFVQFIANLNPIFHLNHLFVAIWNQVFEWNSETLVSISYIAGFVIVSFLVLVWKRKR